MAPPGSIMIPIADFSKAVVQAPAFLRADGAAESMENIEISLKGRPVIRKGYEVIDTSNLSIGTEDDEYTEGDQVVVAHWLGDEDTPDGIKRLYYLPMNASWVQDEIGRLLYIVNRGDNPKIVDVKDNVAYDWNMPAPTVDRNSNFEMELSDLDELNVNRDLAAIESGDIEKAGITSISQPTDTEVYIDVRAQTDITSSLVAVADVSGDFVRVIYDGSLAQGGHRFFWDGRNESGAVVVAGQYIIVFYIDSISGKTIENTSLNNQEPEEGWWSEFVEGFTIGITLGISFLLDVIFSEENTGLGNVTITDSSPNPSKFYLSGQFRVVCFTYTNEELNIESRPSLGLKKRIYFWHTEDEDPPEFDVDIELISRNRPPWATHINIYVSENPTTLLQQNELLIKAIETGFDFFRIGIIEVSENTLSDYEGVIDSSSLRLDSFEHDGPVEGFHTIGAYGVGLWGAAKNRVYFSKIGNNGEQRIYALPSENALVPHSFPLSRSGQSLIQYIHPAAHDSALLVFKRDAIHVIRGKGVISGLYDPNTIVEVDIDASQVMEGVGTMSPRSVLTVGSAVYFVGSDNRFYQYGMNWRGQTEVRDVGLPIQRYLNEFDVVELQNLVAFLYGNSYCLITPERVIIMDMNRKYWTTASWRLKDAFWSRGGIQAESILYGLTQDDELVELFKGETDGENTIGWLWRSNPVLIPSESSITGILAVHTTTPSPTINCRVDIDDVIGEAEEFIPEKSNDFRCGIHGYGSRFSVQLEGSSEPPLLDRIEAEVFPVP